MPEIERSGLTLLIANPGVMETDGVGFKLFALGYGCMDPLPPDLALFDVWSLSEWVENHFQEATVILVKSGRDRGSEVLAYRGVNSAYDVYFSPSYREDSVVLSDTFRNTLASMPRDPRAVDERAVVDHFLFRTSPGRHSYVQGVHRLGHGEVVRFIWDRRGLSWLRRQTHRIGSSEDEPASHGQLVSRTAAALDYTLRAARLTASDCNLFSGGIDSSLLQVSARSLSPPSVAIDSPEFSREIAYADYAAKLLGLSPGKLWIREREYRERLEATIAGLALPPHHLQTVLLDAAFQQPGVQRCICGQFADALFGFAVAGAVRKAMALMPFVPLARLAVRLGSALPRSPVCRRSQFLLKTEDALAKGLLDPKGFAASFGTYTELDRSLKLFGKNAVEERLRTRAFYTMEKVDLSASVSHSFGHLEFAHCVDFLCDDAVSLWRQLASARRVELLTPFNSKALMAVLLSVPAHRRYVRCGVPKYILKDLLRMRLPAYPVAQGKLSTGLPRERYFRTGPLRDSIEDFPLPDFVPPSFLEELRNDPGETSWNLLTFQMWQHLVLKCGQLQVIPGTRVTRLALDKKSAELSQNRGGTFSGGV